MTEVLFAASVAFVGYAIYVLVGEQMTVTNDIIIEVKPEPLIEPVKVSTPKPTRTNASVAKTAPVAVKKTKSVPELVGLAAGNIWKHLNKNGPTAVAKLVKELPEDNKTIQRSIGWLAQEDKITLNTIGRVETIALKD